jgi:predicted kinase
MWPRSACQNSFHRNRLLCSNMDEIIEIWLKPDTNWVKLCHNAGMKQPATLYLIVGLPGAGKTTKARQLEIEALALRFTPDEWMKSLFGRNIPAERDALEGRLIWIALRALQLHTNVVLDFGFWSKDERSSLRWIARQLGATSQVIYLPIDRETQRKRVQTRFVEAPDQTWPMSEEELTQWRGRFDEPDEAELQGTMLEDAPHGYASWSAWAAMRWPTLPDEYA